MEYSAKKSVVKGIKYAVIFLIASGIDSVVSQNLWGINSITIGGLMVMLVNFLKHKYGVKML